MAPSEAIKTRMIQDKALAKPRFTGTLHGIATIAREEGASSLYRGLTATMLRQGANSAVRLSSYSALRSTYETSVGHKPGSAPTFAMGALAGVITVYCTMPFEWVFGRSVLRSAAHAFLPSTASSRLACRDDWEGKGRWVCWPALATLSQGRASCVFGRALALA